MRQEARTWVDQPALALTLDDPMFRPIREQWRGLAGGSGPAVNYYELLGVERDASPDLIKKQVRPDNTPHGLLESQL